jgi:hypothetical protein
LYCLRFLACPARFERATYALEEFVATGMYKYFNVYNVKWLCVINYEMGFGLLRP